MDVGKPAVEQVGDDLGLARAEHLFGNLAAGREGAVGQRLLVARARQLEFERAVGRRQHDERALRAGDLDRGIEHEREHFLQHAS
jgi:hypothetical protein